MELKPLFRFCQLIILLLRSVAPLSFLYIFVLFLSLANCIPLHYNLLTTFWERKSFFHQICFSLFTLWMCVEVGFYFYYARTLRRFQTRRPPNTGLNSITRKQLVHNCFKAMAVSQDFDKVFSVWFLGADFNSIHRENFESWMAWAFFDKDPPELDQEEVEELRQLRGDAEKFMNHIFPEGFNPKVNCMRLTIDPVYAMHRPLMYYGWVNVLHSLAHLMLLYLGFKEKKIHKNSPHTFWYRPSNKPTHTGVPIVFVHGIGIGFVPYLGLLYHFPRSVPCYLIEWRHVSMKLTERVPSINETVTGIAQMLESDGHAHACFIGHSLGTTAVSWMIRERPEMVASTVLLDPITILLCEPTVCHNFVYRTPTTCVELLMNYFVSRELYISHVISRHFAWCRNIIFSHQLPKGGASIFLGGADSIVPAHPIGRYLQRTIGNHSDSDIDVMFYENKEHGEVMLRPDILEVVVSRIHERCRSGERPMIRSRSTRTHGRGAGRLVHSQSYERSQTQSKGKKTERMVHSQSYDQGVIISSQSLTKQKKSSKGGPSARKDEPEMGG